MQREVFGTELDAATLRELYDVVGDVQGEAGVARDDAGQEGLTRSGLEYLFALMVQAGDLENAWNLLRAFHLRDDLSLDDEWVERGLEAVVGGAGPGRALELSGEGSCRGPSHYIECLHHAAMTAAAVPASQGTPGRFW